VWGHAFFPPLLPSATFGSSPLFYFYRPFIFLGGTLVYREVGGVGLPPPFAGPPSSKYSEICLPHYITP